MKKTIWSAHWNLTLIVYIFLLVSNFFLIFSFKTISNYIFFFAKKSTWLAMLKHIFSCNIVGNRCINVGKIGPNLTTLFVCRGIKLPQQEKTNFEGLIRLNFVSL